MCAGMDGVGEERKGNMFKAVWMVRVKGEMRIRSGWAGRCLCFVV